MLVVFAHLGIGKYATSYLNSFYMPLFFFLSGCVFSSKKSFKLFLVRKIKTIIVPYFALGVPMILFVIITNFLQWTNKYDGIIRLCLQFLIQKRFWTIWFLACLFGATIAYYVLKKYIKKDILAGLLILVLSVIELLYYYFNGCVLPWNVDAIPIAVLFIHLGDLFYSKSKTIMRLTRKHIRILLIALMALHIGLWALNLRICGQGLEMFYSQYGIPPLTLLSALSGVLVVIIISSFINIGFLRYLGQNTLLLFAWHHTIIIPIIRWIFAYLGLSTDETMGILAVLEVRLLEFIMVMIILIVFNVFISNSRLKFMIGK